ncbi:MAG TPA: CCA tRNA nucleotidyltransferase, partial [Spirochaetes bacterium]|nr:CCA tRNA nucleotidyltransferase [Spirochaetota bacterium]
MDPIKKSALRIIKTLTQHDFKAYYAGGSVRDMILKQPFKDIDIATSAKPHEVMKLFKRTIPVGLQFGVVVVLMDNIPFEVTTFRKDGTYQDGRHP